MDPYLGEIRIFAGTYAPKNWHFCDGTLLPVSQFEALFSLIGNAYGGDGRTTFALPDLRAVVPVGTGTLPGGSTYNLGQKGGLEEVTITADTMPEHSHSFVASRADAVTGEPNNNYLAVTNGNNSTIQPPYPDVNLYVPVSEGSPNAELDERAVNANQSDNLAHNNRMPYLTVNYIICMNGVYPQPE